jgi:hypothetical protein
MRVHTFWRLLTGGAVVATVLGVLAAPASANVVDTYWVTDDFAFSESDTCGFPIEWHQYGDYKVANFYANDGILLRSLATGGHGRYLLSATANGTTLTGPVTGQLVFTWSPEGDVISTRSAGLQVAFKVPGSGTVYLDTGRIDFAGEGLGGGEITFAAGPHQLWNGDVEELCAALA